MHPQGVKRMAKYYKKGSLGKSTQTTRDDPDWTEVRLSSDEYDDLLRQIQEANTAAKKAEDDRRNAADDAALKMLEYEESVNKLANDKIDKIRKRYQDELQEANRARQAMEAELQRVKSEMAKQREKAKADLAAKEEEVRQAQGLNENLLRIARERANASRCISPKKKHDGYLVLSSRQWTEHYTHTLTDEEYNALDPEIRDAHSQPYNDRRTVTTWKSVLQTPHNASLPLEQIRDLIEERELRDGGVLSDIGCQLLLADGNEDGRRIDFDTVWDDREKNLLYRWQYRANFKSRLWEIDIYTTKGLTVPEDRRPSLRNAKTTEKSGKGRKKRKHDQ